MNKSHESYLVPFFKEMNAIFPKEWCVLHSYETLPCYSESDVDMAFSGSDVSLLESIIKKVGNEYGWKIYQKLWYDVQYCYYYVLKHNEKNLYLAIDFLIDNEGVGKYGFKTTTLTTNCIIKKNLFPVPSPEIAFCYKLNKRIVKKRSLSEDRAYLVKQYIASDPVRINTFLEQQYGLKGMEIVLKYLQKPNFNPTEEDLEFLNQGNKIRNHTLKRGYWEMKRTLYRVRYPSGMIIQIPLLEELELQLFCDLLEKKVDILFRFIILDKNNSMKTRLAGLAGSALVICPKKKFNPKRALCFNWGSFKQLPLDQKHINSISSTGDLADTYYRAIVDSLSARMSKKLST